MIIVAAAFLLPQFALAQSGELKVMSYNIRMGSANDGTNSWIYRCGATIEMLEDQKPDVFGVQEALKAQIDLLEEFADNYDYVGVGRDDGKKDGEYMAIFWNKKAVKLMDWGTFWLSETPEEPSMGWDAACKRTATWALMKDKRTGKRFYFVNTHLDHVGVEARKNGLKLIVDRIAEINPEGYPMVLTGDFNMKPSAPELNGLDACMKSARKFASQTDSHATFNNWGKAKGDEIIDYIYYSGFSSCLEYQTITRKYDNRKFISDHYPITARLIF
jgi:endonuclease/exonuclease/phosphatase family metal-dependent hydrolase